MDKIPDLEKPHDCEINDFDPFDSVSDQQMCEAEREVRDYETLKARVQLLES